MSMQYSELKVDDQVKLISIDATTAEYGHEDEMKHPGDIIKISHFNGNCVTDSYGWSYHIDDLESINTNIETYKIY